MKQLSDSTAGVGVVSLLEFKNKPSQNTHAGILMGLIHNYNSPDMLTDSASNDTFWGRSSVVTQEVDSSSVNDNRSN